MSNKELNESDNSIRLPEKHVSNEHEMRLSKVTTLENMGINPWPAAKKVTATTAQALQEFDDTKEESYTLAGRIMTRRDHGKTFFAHLMDRAGTIQLYIKKDVVGDAAFDQFVHLTDIGDILWVKGTTFKTKTGEITLKVAEFTLLSKCLYPLPEKFHGLTDTENRYRQRYLDLISNHESREKFKKRSAIIRQIRDFLESHDFLEVETPMLHPIPGGAAARPFVTHHNAYDMDLYLRIAPELYLKRLTVGGFERVYEINRNFRNEGISTRHNPEFTAVEFYLAHGDWQDGLQLTENLFRSLVQKCCNSDQILFHNYTLDFGKPFQQMTMAASLQEVGGLNGNDLTPEKIDTLLTAHRLEVLPGITFPEKIYTLFEALVEPKLIQPTFITEFPTAVSPLSRKNDKNAEIVDRFELFIAGMELANGFSELNNPFDQAQRFKEQVSARAAGNQEAHHYDADFVHALEYAMPPTVGVGFGVDRLVMLLTSTSSIKDVILFPTLKLAHEAKDAHKK